MKLNAEEHRRGVDLRDVLKQERPRRQRKPTKAAPSEFRPIEYVETTLHAPARERWDPGCDDGGVRLYCTSSPRTHGDDNARWALQVRARVKPRGGGESKRFAVGTASMSLEDLRWLRDQINAELRRKR